MTNGMTNGMTRSYCKITVFLLPKSREITFISTAGNPLVSAHVVSLLFKDFKSFDCVRTYNETPERISGNHIMTSRHGVF